MYITITEPSNVVLRYFCVLDENNVKFEGSLFEYSYGEGIPKSYGVDFDNENEFYDPTDDFTLSAEEEKAVEDGEESGEIESKREYIKDKIIAALIEVIA